MIMKKKETPLLDDHLQSISHMQEAATDDFFYTRLKARMEKESGSGWSLPLRPAWIIGTLALFITVNTLLLTQRRYGQPEKNTTASTLQTFAAAYDQTISSPY